MLVADELLRELESCVYMHNENSFLLIVSCPMRYFISAKTAEIYGELL